MSAASDADPMMSRAIAPDTCREVSCPASEPAVSAEGARTRAQAGWITRGSSEYLRAGLALFLAGFATFSLLYCVQPLLPVLTASFRVTPAEGSLALSLTTGLVAVSIVLTGAWSQAMGRRGLMFASMAVAAGLNMAAAVVPSWQGLLVARALEGLALGGVPAVAIAWLTEEIDPRDLGRTMGLYVAGTAFGGMAGRVGISALTDAASWRLALGTLGALCLVAATGFVLLLPPERRLPSAHGLDPAFHLRTLSRHLRHAGLLRLYAAGFLLMSVFVTLFNYATFRLSGAPYALSQTEVSLIFLAYGFGMVSSAVAGRLIGRFSRRRLLAGGFLIMLAGALLTLAAQLPVIIAGIALLTAGFFVGHAVASSSIGRLAQAHSGHAASLYLLFYYLGSSVVGSAGGWFWQHGGWPAIVALTGGLAAAGGVLALTERDRGEARA